MPQHKITFNNKRTRRAQPPASEINYFLTASDINEIKTVINNNADDVDRIKQSIQNTPTSNSNNTTNENNENGWTHLSDSAFFELLQSGNGTFSVNVDSASLESYTKFKIYVQFTEDGSNNIDLVFDLKKESFSERGYGGSSPYFPIGYSRMYFKADSEFYFIDIVPQSFNGTEWVFKYNIVNNYGHTLPSGGCIIAGDVYAK